MSFEPIENHGVIGNMCSIALAGMNGSIDFLCYPRFDSPTVFAALLDDECGGRFQIKPEFKTRRVRQLYLPDTNILITRFLAEEGVAELTDFMPISLVGEQPNEIVRMVEVVRGEATFSLLCQPRFNYALCGHTTQMQDHCVIFLPQGNACPAMALYSSIDLKQDSQDVVAQFTLRAGEKAIFILALFALPTSSQSWN